MARPKKSETNETPKATILDSFDFISQSDKNKFLKKSESLKVKQEDLLSITIQALLNDLIPFEVETVTKLSLPKKEKKTESE